MNTYVIRTIVEPKKEGVMYLYYIFENHFTSDKLKATQFESREEAMKVADTIEFNTEIVVYED